MNDLINKIHNCDNIEILKQLPDKSVQVFLEDIPYGITACKWDKMPDLKEYWDLRLSKLKDNGCFVLFGCEPFSSYLRMSNIKMYKYDWIWNKKLAGNGILAKQQPLKIHELISIFYVRNNYNPIKTKGKQRKKMFNGLKQTDILKKLSESKIYINNDYYPKSIIDFSIAGNRSTRIHPTQKSIDLFEYLIKTYSNEGDLIFDGYSGSGTTAIASYNTKRNFICCEIDKEYYDKSIKRLNEKQNDLSRFL